MLRADRREFPLFSGDLSAADGLHDAGVSKIPEIPVRLLAD
jgi:hypothetical protein